MAGATRRRLDAELVRRGLAPSREQARASILAGRVTVGGAPAVKAAHLVAPADAIHVTGPGRRFVSRGGEKLDAALERFAVVVRGRHALDAGASTGGFTDCLLQRGAESVVAVDVGYGQLHERLRTDPRVVVLDRTNVRHLTPEMVGHRVEVVVADLSFISLRTVLDALLGVAGPEADLVLLVKPPFEAGRQEVARGRGVIRSPVVWRRVLGECAAALAARRATVVGAMVSPLRGADGNVEFLLHAAVPAHPVREAPAGPAVDLEAGLEADLDDVVSSVATDDGLDGGALGLPGVTT